MSYAFTEGPGPFPWALEESSIPHEGGELAQTPLWQAGCCLRNKSFGDRSWGKDAKGLCPGPQKLLSFVILK